MSPKVQLGLACVLFASLAYAQFETSEVLGTVRDPSQAPISKATVTLTSQDTGIEAKTTTDDNGNYDFFNVKVGTYTVTVEGTGFSKFTTKDIRVNVEARQRVDASLQVGEVTTEVTVTGAASVLETDTSDHSQVINTQQIIELPLNGRDYASLALLATNVHISPQALSFSPSATPREGAVLTTTSCWTAWTTTPTAPATRIIRARWCSRLPTHWPSSK
jgi:hypothetical protein